MTRTRVVTGASSKSLPACDKIHQQRPPPRRGPGPRIGPPTTGPRPSPGCQEGNCGWIILSVVVDPCQLPRRSVDPLLRLDVLGLVGERVVVHRARAEIDLAADAAPAGELRRAVLHP